MELETTTNLFPGATIGTTSITIPYSAFSATPGLTNDLVSLADVLAGAIIAQLAQVYTAEVRNANPDVSHRVTIPASPNTEQAFINGVVTVFDRFDVTIQSYVPRTNLPTYNPLDFAQSP